VAGGAFIGKIVISGEWLVLGKDPLPDQSKFSKIEKIEKNRKSQDFNNQWHIILLIFLLNANIRL